MIVQNRTAFDWEDARVFVALARHGSLSAAARSLGISHVTVSRRVAALEQAVGERLAERRPDGYVLTPAGTRVLSAANDMESAAAALVRGGAEGRPAGLVRINAPPTISQGFLVARLAALTVTQPGLDIEVATDVRNVSLERREADIALRLARPQDGDVIARPLVSLGFGFYSTQARCRSIADGDDPVFIGFDEINAHLPEAAWLAQSFPRARVAIRTNNHLAQAIAAREGGGVALIPHFVGRADPLLHPCPLQPSPPSRDLWMVTRRQDRKDMTIRTVADFIADLFTHERRRFEVADERASRRDAQPSRR